jgi:hypothetical protein
MTPAYRYELKHSLIFGLNTHTVESRWTRRTATKCKKTAFAWSSASSLHEVDQMILRVLRTKRLK